MITQLEKYGPINSIVLSRSAESDNVYLSDDQSIEQNGLCEIKIKDNQIMNFNDRSDYLPDLLSTLGGLEYYLNDYVSKGILYYNLCDKYTAKIGENYYTCVMFNNETLINNGLEENVNTPLPEASETDYTKADKTDQRINQTYLIVDKQNQRIDSVITNVTEQNNKISQITQTVDEINSKISDIADITISGESNFASFELDNINESEPIMVKIHPTVRNISYIYPSPTLYPSNNLFSPSRKIRFHNKDTNEDFDYELPDDLLFYDNDTYDKFYLDYDSHTCQVIKRCRYNANGEVVALGSEITTNYPYPIIELTDGDYVISLPSYEYGYLFARLMVQNIYTTQFATKAEVSSQISQTSQSINLSVDQKLTNYSTTTQMNSAISLKANEINSTVSETYATKTALNQTSSNLQDEISTQTETLSSRISQTARDITLSVSNGSTTSGITIGITKEDGTTEQATGTIQMNGLVKFTDLSTSGSTTINGSNITTGTISANRISGGTISGASFRVTGSNAITVYGNDNLKDAELNRYGLYVYNNSGNYSGKVTAANISYSGSTVRGIAMVSEDGNKAVFVCDLGTQVNGNLHATGTITQGSLEGLKKNIKLYDKNVLDTVVNSDIYSYNYKTEKDEDKQHVGFIIGNKYNTPSEVIRGDGIDIYSMCSILWKAVQEQQNEIDKLKKEMEELKNAKN